MFRGEKIHHVWDLELTDYSSTYRYHTRREPYEQGFRRFTVRVFMRESNGASEGRGGVVRSLVPSGTQVKTQAQEFWLHEFLLHRLGRDWVVAGFGDQPRFAKTYSNFVNRSKGLSLSTQFSTLFLAAYNEACLELLPITSTLSMCQITLSSTLPMMSPKSWPGCRPWSPKCGITIFASSGWIV